MTKTMNHSNCTHPATKAGRAACRRLHAAQERDEALAFAARLDAIHEVITAYHAGDDLEEIMGRLRAIDPDLTEGYYNGDLDPDEIMGRAARG